MKLSGYFWDRWLYFTDKPSWDITTTYVNSALHPSGVVTSTNCSWGKGRKVATAGWQVTLCDLIWRAISHSGVVISITNSYIRFTSVWARGVNGWDQDFSLARQRRNWDVGFTSWDETLVCVKTKTTTVVCMIRIHIVRYCIYWVISCLLLTIWPTSLSGFCYSFYIGVVL